MIRKQINRIANKVLDWSQTGQQKGNYAPLRKVVYDSIVDKFLVDFTGQLGREIRETMLDSNDEIHKARTKGDEQQAKILEAHREGYLKGMSAASTVVIQTIKKIN